MTEMANVVMRAIKASEAALKAIIKEVKDVPFLLTNLTRDDAKELFFDGPSAFDEDWGRLRPKLVPFSRGSLARDQTDATRANDPALAALWDKWVARLKAPV